MTVATGTECPSIQWYHYGDRIVAMCQLPIATVALGLLLQYLL
jgi:hypothetical protein